MLERVAGDFGEDIGVLVCVRECDRPIEWMREREGGEDGEEEAGVDGDDEVGDKADVSGGGDVDEGGREDTGDDGRIWDD